MSAALQADPHAEEWFAWACGLFEGEGTIHAAESVRLMLGSVDLEVVKRFREVVGAGTVYGPYANRQHQPMYQWSLSRADDVIALLDRLEPWLSERRRAQAARAREVVRKRGECRIEGCCEPVTHVTGRYGRRCVRHLAEFVAEQRRARALG